MARSRLRRWVTSIGATELVVMVGVAAGVAVLRPAPARAQNAEAEVLFREGDRLMDAGKIKEACAAFQASNRIEPRAGTLIRLGDCREKNQQLASAWSAYTDALARVKDPRKREIAAARVAVLEPRLSQLTISVPDEARITGLVITRNGNPVDAVLWNRGMPVDGGDYVVAGRAPGHEEWSTKVTVPVEGGRVQVEVPRFKELKELMTPELGGGAGPEDLMGPTGPTGPVDRPGLFTPRRKLAVGLVGGGAVLAIGAAFVGLNAQGLEDDARLLCPTEVCSDATAANALMERARSRALLANIGYGLAAGAAIGGAVLWFTGGPRGEHAVAVYPTADDGVTTRASTSPSVTVIMALPSPTTPPPPRITVTGLSAASGSGNDSAVTTRSTFQFWVVNARVSGLTVSRPGSVEVMAMVASPGGTSDSDTRSTT